MLPAPGQRKNLSRRNSAASFLRQKLSLRRKSSRTRALPELPKLNCAQTVDYSNLQTESPQESPRTVLKNVGNFFLNELSNRVCSYSDEGTSINSTQASSCRPSSKSEKKDSPMLEMAPCASPDVSQDFQRALCSGRRSATTLSRPKSALQLSLPLETNFSKPASNFTKSDPGPLSPHGDSEKPPFVSTTKAAPSAMEGNSTTNAIANPASLEEENCIQEKDLKSNSTKPQKANSLPLRRPQPLTARECLQRGIEAHQNDDMPRSAILFERSAKQDGGCGVGMLMWALALRHGWGCNVDTMKAFGWLQLAAETLLQELHQLQLKKDRHEGLRSISSKGAKTAAEQEMTLGYITAECRGITAELLLALYELGQCLMHGWGCKKDKALAVEYYSLAATLGDADAQKELAYCYEVGHGVKKNFTNAARYYRMACAQGIKMMGYQWIWKEKYNTL